MADQASQVRDPVEILAEEFLNRRRRGELPSLTEYTSRYPDLADEIREVFPALAMMHDIDPQSAELGRSMGGAVGLGSRLQVRQLGDYRILREVGQGGMGIVYEARQESLGRRVALKVLLPTISSRAKFRERFQREARAAARLHHTNIVPVFGVGEDQNVLYYAMQFIQGQGLDLVLRDVKRMRGQGSVADLAHRSTIVPTGFEAAQSLLTGQFENATPSVPEPARSTSAPVSSAVGTQSDLSILPEARYYRSIALLGVQAAEGLAHAHAQGILHRDIKPSNLLLDAHGTVWITDFGLAKTEEGDDLTRSGEVIGTLRYVPPERFEGKSDVRSDIYSLGVTLYEMLTLSPPFKSDDRLNLMAQITADTPSPPSRLAPNLPRDLETIVQKAMAREPTARYSTARELADDLRRFLENRAIKARRSTPTELLKRWCRRNPAIASLTGAVFLLLVCLTVGSLAAAIQLNRKEAERTEKLYEALVAQANASRYSRRIGQRFDTLDAVRKAADLVRERHMAPERLDRLRTLAIAALTLPDLRMLQSWEGLSDTWQRFASDVALRQYAVDEDGQISLRRMGTNEEIARLDGLRPAPFISFSPGGRFLLAEVDHRIRGWDLSQNPPTLVHDGADLNWAFNPDGRHVLIGQSDGSVRLYDWGAPHEKFEMLAAKRPADNMIAFDPTGERLAAVNDRGVEILDARTGKILVSVPEKLPTYWVAWHPSGNYLAVVCSMYTIHIWDLKRNILTADLKGCRNGGLRVAFSPDGERLLSCGYEGITRVWDWRTSRELLQLPGASELQVSSEGRILIARGKQLGIFGLATGGERRSIIQQSKAGKDVVYWSPQVHPAGRLMAVPMADATRLFDLQSGDEVALLPLGGFTLAFSENGSLLTGGSYSSVRWPIQSGPDPNQMRIGPPEPLYFGGSIDLSSDKKGEVVGLAVGNGAVIVRPGQKLRFLGPHADARHVSISPDGRFAATGNHGGDDGVKIWNTETGELLAQFPAGSNCSGRFTPDGQWMYVSGTRTCFIVKTGTWEKEADRWEGQCAFSPDSSVVATSPSSGVIRFQDANTGREIVRLEDPEGEFGYVVFTPDGGKLIGCSDLNHDIHVWDLRAIRRQLAEMGLDWDRPPYLPENSTSDKPLQLNVDLGILDPNAAVRDIVLNSWLLALNPFNATAYLNRAKAYARKGDFKEAEADLTLAIAFMPANHKSRGEALFRRSDLYAHVFKDKPRASADLLEIAQLDLSLSGNLKRYCAEECNGLAWHYATGAEKQRDLDKAVILIRKALKFSPQDWSLMNTQGVVCYRLAQYPQAIEWLTRSLDESKGEAAAYDLFFLAMSHTRLGAADKAKDSYNRAVQWTQEHPNHPDHPEWTEELKAIRSECESVLAGARPVSGAPSP